MITRRFALTAMLCAGLVAGTASAAVAGSSDDQDIADASVLTEDDASDFGFVGERVTNEILSPPNVPECKKIRALDKASDRAPNAETAFTDGTAINVTTKVTVYPSARAARALVRAYTGSSGEECLDATLERNLRKTLDPGSEYEFTSEAIDVPLGDSSIGYRVVITVTDSAGNSFALYVEGGLIQVGRGLVQQTVQSPDAPFDGSEDLATIVTDDLTENLDS
jgi:hypothetical protein